MVVGLLIWRSDPSNTNIDFVVIEMMLAFSVLLAHFDPFTEDAFEVATF